MISREVANEVGKLVDQSLQECWNLKTWPVDILKNPRRFSRRNFREPLNNVIPVFAGMTAWRRIQWFIQRLLRSLDKLRMTNYARLRVSLSYQVLK